MGLISVSGKINSGKDTIGKIIQWLVYFKKHPNYEHYTDEDNLKTLIEFVKADNTVTDLSDNFIIKKWADSLKDIVCILIGCTREQLEDREFKEKELGEEWWYYTNTLFNTEDKELVSYLEANNFIHNSTEWYIMKHTPRTLLQLLGTECGRNIIHPNIWVNALMSKYKPFNKGKAHDLKDFSELYTHKECSSCKKSYSGYKRQYLCKECVENESIQFYQNWIVTDCRFENELKAVKDRGGVSIRVNRTPRIIKLSENTSYEFNPVLDEEHYSETALDNAEFDYTIDNNGTVEELIEKVREVLIKEKIICP